MAELRSPRRIFLSALAVLLDLIVVAAVGAVALIVSGAGGRVVVGPLHVSLTSARNPLTIALLALIARSALTDVSFLGIAALPLSHLPRWTLRWWTLQKDRLLRLTLAHAARIVGVIMFVSLLVKLMNMTLHFGFWTGDDVEIHEMTFAHIFGWQWQAWNLRSPFYPMSFIYPVQAALHAMGQSDPGRLIFAGRLVVAGFSLANIWLTFRVARRLFESTPIGFLSALILAANKLHTIGGSTELPRTVSSFFLLAGFNVLLNPEGVAEAAMAGVLIAIAAAMRFSEAIFVVPAFVQLAATRSLRKILAFVLSLGLVSVGIFGLADKLYWGEAFYSLKHIVDFTLVERLSSRGYQPFYEYVRSIPAWCDPLTVALALAATGRRRWSLAVWTWFPVLCLSVLPHKEPRYLIPILPFLAMLAAFSLWRCIEWLCESSADGRDAARRERFSAVFLVACLCAFVFEVSGFWFVRSEADVVVAQAIARQGSVGGIAIEQAWRMGRRLYLSDAAPLVDIDPPADLREVQTVLATPAIRWVALLDGDVRRFGYDSLARAAGFDEVSLPTNGRGSDYRLFRRR